MAESNKQAPTPSANQPAHTVDGQTLPVRDVDKASEFDSIDAFSRLLVGSTADVSDLLIRLLEHWQSEITAQNQATILEDEEDAGDILRYMLIGLLFESQHAVRSSLRNAGSLIVGTASITSSITSPLRDSFLFAPFRATTNKVSNALEDRIVELVQKGRNEEFVGRLMAHNALLETVDWVMDYISEDPAIREMIQEQAIGFSDEVKIGVRERAITSDSVVDTFFRKLFRRTPREALAGPPDEVKQAEVRQDSLDQGRMK